MRLIAFENGRGDQIQVSEETLDCLNETLALVEGQFLATGGLDEVHGGEPDWLANHEVAFFAFRDGLGRLKGVPDYSSALIILRRLAPLIGEFIDESKDMEPQQRLRVVDRFLVMCGCIGDFSLAWGIEDHPHRIVVEMHRRVWKLKRSM